MAKIDGTASTCSSSFPSFSPHAFSSLYCCGISLASNPTSPYRSLPRRRAADARNRSPIVSEAWEIESFLYAVQHRWSPDKWLEHFPPSMKMVSQLLCANRQRVPICAVGSEMVMVDEIPFPPKVTTTKPLSLLGHGITDIEIHFLQIKFTAIGVYLDPEIVGHLQQFKGKAGDDLAKDDLFFDSIISAPVEKFLRVVVIKEIKGAQYGVQLESAVRDRLAEEDKYEEEEEEALEKVTEFFQSKYFKKHSVITYHFPANCNTVEIGFTTEGKEEVKVKVENGNVVEMIQKWYLGGSRAVSPTTVASLAGGLGALLSK